MKDENKIVADGRITYIRRSENGNTVFYLQSVDKANVRNIQFVYKGDFPDGIGIRKKVHVEGYVVAYKNAIEGGKIDSIQYFVAEKVELQRSILEAEFGQTGHFLAKDSFKGVFSGTVSQVIRTENPKWGKLVVAINGRRTSYVVFSYFLGGRLPEFDYEKGDRVCIMSGLSTIDKEVNGKKKHFQNLQIEDIAKMEDEA